MSREQRANSAVLKAGFRPALSVFIFLSFVLTLLSLSTISNAAGRGGEPGRFMSYGAGGRPLAMGGAFYGLADDATAAYWNPAGLAFLERSELVAMYAQLYGGSNLGFMSFAYPTADKGVFGFSYTQLVADGFEKVTVQTDGFGNILSLQNAGAFKDEQRGLGFAWGKAVGESMGLGLNAKVLTRKLDTSSDSHLSMDITTLVRGLMPRHQLGFGLHNIVNIKSGDTDDRLPLTLRLGNNIKVIKNKLSLGLDVEQSQRSGASWRFGGEYWVLSWMAFRFGIQGDPGSTKEPREMNFGAGLNYQNFSLDLANAVHALGFTTRFSASWRFGTPLRVNQEGKVRRVIQTGFDAFKTGNFVVALQRLNQALDAQPGNKTVQGMVDRLGQVVAVIPQAVGDSEIMTYVRKGVAQYVSGTDMKGSVNALRYAFNKDIKNENVLGLLNMVEKTAQVPELTKKIEGPQLFSWIDQKVYDARSAFHEAQYDVVIRRCQDILDLEPNNVVALQVMGSAFFMMDQKEKAATIWRRVLEIDPTDKTVRSFLQGLGK